MDFYYTKLLANMNSLGLLLIPYKELIASTASLITYGQQLSGIFVCNNIRKQRSTDGYSMFPFLTGAVLSTLGYLLASLMTDASTMRTSLIAAAINITYICIYLYYANENDRLAAWRQISSGLALVAALLAYIVAEDPKVLPFRFRLIYTTIILLPFLGLRGIIRRKCTDGVPFLLTLTTTVISFLWFLYGLATNATYSIIQNGLICLLNVIQLSLFAIFPSKLEDMPTNEPNQADESVQEEVKKNKIPKVKRSKSLRFSISREIRNSQ